MKLETFRRLDNHDTRIRHLEAHEDNGGGGGIVVVEHGSDPAVARPDAELVYWVGSVEPDNGLDYDFWLVLV